MDVVVELFCYFSILGTLFLITRLLSRKPKKHQWYEVESTDIANAERKKKRGGR